MVMNCRPDLSSPRYDDPVWWSAIGLLTAHTSRQMTYDLASANLLAYQSSVMLMVIEAVRSSFNDNKSVQDFIDRVKMVGTMVDSSHTAAVQSINSQPMDRKSVEDAKTEAQTKVFNQAMTTWESIFGKRGNPDVEAKIMQTAALLQAKIKESQAPKEDKRKPRQRRRGRG